MMGMGWGQAMLSVGIFWALAIGWAIFLLSKLFPSIREPLKTTRDQAEETPLEILKARYARGEISRSEYEEMKKIL